MRRLGDAEKQALGALRDRGGVWTLEDAPLWDNRFWTERILHSLVKKEYVMIRKDGSFVLVEPGGTST